MIAEGEKWTDLRDLGYLTGLDHYGLWGKRKRIEIEKIYRFWFE